jgi:hypothetical protein
MVLVLVYLVQQCSPQPASHTARYVSYHVCNVRKAIFHHNHCLNILGLCLLQLEVVDAGVEAFDFRVSEPLCVARNSRNKSSTVSKV